MIKTIGIIAILLFSGFCFAQDFKADFDKYCQKGDTTKLKEVLSKWNKTEPKNPELFTSYFNYYVLKSRDEFVSMTTKQTKGKSLQIEDSTGQAVGYLGSEIIYNPEILQKGFNKIDRGIKIYPNRLDMRFGKIHILGETEDWENFTKEIIKTVKYSKKNDNNWTWTYNEAVEDGKEFLLSGIQNYQLRLYNTGRDDLLENMRDIANEILKIYPDHVESLSNISITYLLTGEFEKGVEILLKAEKIAPKDVVILNNIANGYRLSENNEKSIEYYEKVLKLGNEEDKEFAKNQIEKLMK